MSTSQSTIDFILDQLNSIKNVSARKMFGEYALYCDGKVVGLVCDDNLFIKITEAGLKFAKKGYVEGHAYPGAKISMQINEEKLEDRVWLTELVKLTAQNLPMPKPKLVKKKYNV